MNPETMATMHEAVRRDLAGRIHPLRHPIDDFEAAALLERLREW